MEFGNIEKTHESLQTEWKIETAFWEDVRSPIFQYAGRSWRLMIFNQCDCCGHDDYRFMQLIGDVDYPLSSNPFPIEYKFGLKLLNVEVETLASGIIKKYNLTSESHKVLKMSDFCKNTTDDDLITTLTIVCTLKRGTALNFPSLDGRIEKLDTLSDHFKTLLTDEDSCDTSLHVDGKPFKAHRIVLKARSSVFAAMLKHDTSEKQTGVFNIPDCDPDTFHDFLEFLYTGKLDVKSCHQAIHLYKTSDKYGVQELKTSCVKRLQCMTVENFCIIAQFADRYGETDLLFGIQRFFNRNVSQILDTAEWLSLMANDSHLANQLLKNMSK